MYLKHTSNHIKKNDSCYLRGNHCVSVPVDGLHSFLFMNESMKWLLFKSRREKQKTKGQARC